MIVTKRDLRRMERGLWITFTAEEERIILETFGQEPPEYEWTEQDISEQIRKICNNRF